jgi:hypothetical protein
MKLGHCIRLKGIRLAASASKGRFGNGIAWKIQTGRGKPTSSALSNLLVLLEMTPQAFEEVAGCDARIT